MGFRRRPRVNLKSPTVAFNTPGTYTVRLTVADAYGKADTSAATTTVTVKAPENQAPNGTIAAPASAVTVTQGQAVSFKGSGTDADNNVPLTYAWNFGDGGSSTQQTPAYAYGATGTYTVSLTVKDSKGLADPNPETRTVTVVAPTPVAPTPSALVAAYGFNEGSGTTTKDASGRGNTAALAGTRWSSGGRFGRALRFNGFSSIVTVKDAAALRLTPA